MRHYTAQEGTLKASAGSSAAYRKVNQDNADKVRGCNNDMWVIVLLLILAINHGNASRITKEIIMQVWGNPSGNNNITCPIIADRRR